MTPGIEAAKRSGVAFQIHQYEHDASAGSYGLEAAGKLGLPVEQVFKTLVVQLDGGELAVGIVPVSAKLGMKQIARALGAKRAAMARAADVGRATGYVPGGVSPLGQKKRLRTVIDVSATTFSTIHVSAGRRGLELELAPRDLASVVNGTFARISR